MCYDPVHEVKVYYTHIDLKRGDLGPSYYVQSNGDFSVDVRGKFD